MFCSCISRELDKSGDPNFTSFLWNKTNEWREREQLNVLIHPQFDRQGIHNIVLGRDTPFGLKYINGGRRNVTSEMPTNM